ncbi:MAG: DNA methyltransferase [Pseudomonadota bacterium]
MRSKIADNSVDLCYIDPPFNSKRNYFQIYNNQGSEDRAQAQAFVDTWEWGDEAVAGLAWITDIAQLQSGRLTEQTVDLIRGLEKVLKRGALLAYLVHMTQRIVEIHRVLKPTGSFYLHCDPTASHYLKLVLDAVFCGQGGDFLNEIIWKRKTGRGETNHKSSRFGNATDTILFYCKSTQSFFESQFNMDAPGYQDYVEKAFRHVDQNGRRYRIDNLASPSYRPNLIYEYKGYQPPQNGWAISVEKMISWDDEGRLEFPRAKTGRIQRRRYLDEVQGRPVSNLWDDIEMISSQSAERLGYPTQKPEALLERIIRASSNEGDTVLDAYCGCGTTIAVAQRLNRKWIGIDITYQSISLILKRLQDKYPETWPQIEASIKLDGVPRDIESARALANRRDDKTRKEFEKWAVLTYSNNQARINDKKGADGGIDGVAYFLLDKDTNGKAVFQVKSGGATRATLATLNSDRLREKAEFGILISMDAPTKPMRDEIQAAGKFKHPLLQREDDRLQIVTIDDLLSGAQMDLPMARKDAVKSAKEDSGAQFRLI